MKAGQDNMDAPTHPGSVSATWSSAPNRCDQSINRCQRRSRQIGNSGPPSIVLPLPGDSNVIILSLPGIDPPVMTAMT